MSDVTFVGAGKSRRENVPTRLVTALLIKPSDKEAPCECEDQRSFSQSSSPRERGFDCACFEVFILCGAITVFLPTQSEELLKSRRSVRSQKNIGSGRTLCKVCMLYTLLSHCIVILVCLFSLCCI